MTLQYHQMTEEAHEIIEKLKELSLAFNKEFSTATNAPITLIDSGNEIIGKKNILSHLEQLKAELPLWYYCSC